MPVIESIRILYQANASQMIAGTNKATSALSRFGTNAFFLGSRITSGIGLPIALLTKSVVGIGAAFDQAMTESLAIMGRDGQAMRGQMETIAKSIALETKFSAEEAAQAYFFLASSGMNAAESMAALPIAARFAQAGVLDLEKATELLSDAYITLGLRADNPIQNMQNMARVADVLTEANNQAQGTIIEFAQALTNRAGVAMRVFGIDVETGVAALAAFAERGIKGRTAGRQLFIVIRDLQRAVLKKKDAWELLVGPGAVFDMASGKFQNIADIIGVLEDSLEGLSDREKKASLQMLGFQERSLQATLALVGASDRIKELEAHLYSAGGVVQRVSEKQMMSFTNQLGLVQERLKQVGLELFQAFQPTIENHVVPAIMFLIEKLKSLAEWIKTLSPRTKEVIVNFLALAAAIGPVIAGIGALSLVMVPIVGVFGRLAVGWKASRAALLGLVPAFRVLTGAITVHTVAGVTNGKKWSHWQKISKLSVISLKNLRLAWIALRGPIGIAITVIIAAWQAWKLWKSGSEGAKKESKDLSKQIGLTTIRFTQLVNEFKRLYNTVGPLTEDQLNRLAHAEEMLAAATGISVKQMRLEMQEGDNLLKVIENLAIARFREGEAALQAAEKKKQATLEEMALVQERVDAINASIGSGRFTQFALKGTEGGRGLRSFPSGPDTDSKLNDVLQEQLQLLLNKTLIIEDLETSMRQLRYETGQQTKADIEWTTNSENVLDEQKNRQRQIDLQILAEEALTKKIEAMTVALAGQADEGLLILEEAWDNLSDEQQLNESVIGRLWERYSKLREHLAPNAMPEELENVTRGLRLEAEAMEFASSVTGKFIKAMNGVDDNINELLANQGEIVKEFEKLNGVMDPRFFKSHGKVLEDLAEHYSDDLSPAMLEIIKLYEKWKEESKTTTDSVDEDQKKASDSLVKSSNRMAAKMMDKQAELAAFSLSTQDAELVGLKKGYNLMKLAHEEELEEMKANVEKMSEAEQHMGMLRIDEFIANGEKMLATEKRIGLLRALAALDADDLIIRNHEQFSIKWLEIQVDIHKKAENEWLEYSKRVAVLTSMGGLLSELATAIPALNSTAQAISGIASASQAFGESAKSWKAAKTGFDKITAAVGMATAAVAAFNAISKIKSRGGRAAAGALAGAQMGASFGPIGAAVGAGIGALAGAISSDPGWAKIQKSIRQNWHVNVSEELAKAIEKTEKDVGDKIGAMLLHINEVIAESGGVTKENVSKWTREVRDAFSLIDQGVFTTAEAAEVLDENFGALAEAGTMLSGVLQADVFELMLLDEQFQTNSAAIKEFKDAMMDLAVTGLVTFTSGVTILREKVVEAFDTSIEKTKEAHDAFVEAEIKNAEAAGASQKEIDRIRDEGAKKWSETLDTMHVKFRENFFDKTFGDWRELNEFTELTFFAMTEGGMSFLEALDALEPSLAELNENMKITGNNGGDAIEQLLRIRAFKKENEGLILQVEGLNKLMVGLANTGNMSQKSFTKFGEAATRQFNTLIEKGLDNNEALMLMAPTLQTLSDLQTEYGLIVDEDTQKIIDLAKEKGILGEKAKTVDEKMLEAQMVMVEVLGEMVRVIGGELPESFKTLMAASDQASQQVEKDFKDAASDIQENLNNIEIPSFDTTATVQINYNDPGYNFQGGHTNRAAGGIISKPELAMIGEGGEPEMIGPVGFMSKALEGALSKTGPSQVEREMLNELHGLRSDLKTLPLHLRDAIILTG